ncbi:DUF7344 domain-containing protein [Halogranum rubrum]|uniref:DUF7344 domain-containing protein n=1 Tax=Halogranum salarium B-1 TaxID=1210908 RepID=J3ETB2_9EURY|nr:hypothetical protein [Halogranum salarium]EJN57342.1 hypothetical protein HSB1_43050 [Halogranum salarium B-1]
MSTQSTSATEPSAQTATEQPLSRDDVFHLLQNARRRGVVRYLSERDDDAVYEMRDIATQVAAWENNKPIAQLNSDERQRVYISLYQGHLPKLAEKGLIEYNQSRGRVESTPRLEQLEAYVTTDTDEQQADSEPANAEDSTSLKYYSGATAVSVALFVATTLGLAPAVIAGSLATIITGLFGVTTLGVTSRTLR